MGLPDRETGGVPGLRGRGGAAPACALGPARLGGGGSSATGWGSWATARLGGATLPLEEMVTLGFAAACSVTSFAVDAATAAGASGSTCGAVRAAGAFAAGARAAGAARTPDSPLTPVAALPPATGRGLAASASGLDVTAASASGFTGSARTGPRRTGPGFTGSARTGPGFGGSGSTVAGSATFTGSGGRGGFSSPSRSARRRTRSACASTMLEECDLTPMLSAMQRSSVP